MAEKHPPPLPSPDVVRDLVKVGVEQIRIRQQELELQERDSQRQYEFAKKALEAQVEDRRDARTSRRKRTIDRYVFVFLLLCVGLAFIIGLGYMGKDALAKEIATLVGTFLAGGLSGYGISKARGHREIDADSENLEESED